MSSLRWSALFLSLASPFACAPHYDVGDADPNTAAGNGGVGGRSTTGGNGGSGDQSSGGTGGSSGTNGSGGASATGGSGGSGEAGGSDAGGSDPSGGTGGSVAGAGGASIGTGGFAGGGTGGMPVSPECGAPMEPEYRNLVAPAEMWSRISFFLYDELRDPPGDLPEETTPESTLELFRLALAQSRMTSASGRAALTPFMRRFLGQEQPSGAVGDTPADYWARTFTMEGVFLSYLFVGDKDSNPPFGLFGTIAELKDGLSARGNFISSKFFCREVPSFPDEEGPVIVGPNQTRRDALNAAINEPQCFGCHSVTDPLGFPLEALTPDTLEYRTTENGLPIDTSGVYQADFSEFRFADMDELSAQISTSCEVARCLATQLFNEAAPYQDAPAYTPAELDRAVYLFGGDALPQMDRFQIQVLLEAIVTSPTFLE